MSWIKALLAFFGLVEKGEDLVHDRNVALAGQDKVIAEDNLDAARAELAAGQAMVDTDRESVVGQLRRGGG